MYNMHVFCTFSQALIRRPLVFSRAFDFGALRGTAGALRRTPGSRRSSAARPVGIQSRASKLF